MRWDLWSHFQDLCNFYFSFPGMLFSPILADSLSHSIHVSARGSSPHKIFLTSLLETAFSPISHPVTPSAFPFREVLT